jgi:hypothetical protein
MTMQAAIFIAKVWGETQALAGSGLLFLSERVGLGETCLALRG